MGNLAGLFMIVVIFSDKLFRRISYKSDCES